MKCILLLHWSNTKKAWSALDMHYTHRVARKFDVEFFPLQIGSPRDELVSYFRGLANDGVIEVDLRQDPPVAPVSIVIAQRWPHIKATAQDANVL